MVLIRFFDITTSNVYVDFGSKRMSKLWPWTYLGTEIEAQNCISAFNNSYF